MAKRKYAFPREAQEYDAQAAPHQHGMTMRQWYAGQALKGMLASAHVVDRFPVDKDKWAAIAFEWADAMIKAEEA